METAKLKKFAQFARRSLLEQISAKLKLVLAENSTARRENPTVIAEIEKAIRNQPAVGSKGKEPTDGWKLTADSLVERVAYIWFNRFCALRFMDVNRYTRIGVVSPAEGQFQPEILAEAKMGHIDDEMVPEKTRQQIFALLHGKAPSRDPQGEAYRLLVVAACNFFHGAMPFLFQRIDDYTELLMPDDLLSGNSILAYTREAMTPDVCGVDSSQPSVISSQQQNTDSWRLKADNSAAEGGVEVIGWLYQFYISEKKDEVFDGLKKNKKITPENIPAATQLFTPHWIVKYLVENSLGRLWMLNRPNSSLVDRMKYYIPPEISVGSEKWEVESKENYDGSAKLSGTNRLAEGNGRGGVGVSGNQNLSQGGTLRTDQSGSQGGSVDSLEYSGGASASIDSGVQKLSIDSARVKSGSGNANHDSSAAGVSSSAANRPDSQSIRGNQEDDLFTDRKVEITSHSSLSTSHSTSHSASIREEDFLRIEKPEDIKICDPACGSGHMLTYAFDLLYAIYQEEGYEPAEIPEKILTHNLYGIEIDERAGELAAFALTMKARAKQRRFFNKGVKPNICVLENIHFDESELKDYMDFVGRDLFTAPLQTTLRQFEEADNFGSLIRPDVTDVDGMLRILESKNVSGHLFLSMTHQKVLQALRQADYLSPKYHVVIANPPYMGGKGMNGRLGAWAKDNYPNSKSDLFAMFIERNLDLAQKHGAVAMITMQSWMFLSSFEALRVRLLGQNTLLSMAHLGARAFDSISGEVVSTTAFVLENANRLNYKGGYLRLVAGNSEAEKNDAIRESVKNSDCGWLFRASASDFRKIPGSPIAYWVSNKLVGLFNSGSRLGDIAQIKAGMATSDNDRFLRFWNEVSRKKIGFDVVSTKETVDVYTKWYPYNKGGSFRKWAGNNDYVVNWDNDGEDVKKWVVSNPKDPNTTHWSRRIVNTEIFFRECFTWSDVGAEFPSFRYLKIGFVIGNRGPAIIQEHLNRSVLGYLNGKIPRLILNLLNPTLTFNVGNIADIVFSQKVQADVSSQVSKCIGLARYDWDSYETSWDFTSLPLLNPDYRQPTLKATYQKLRAHWREMTLEMQRLEEDNNRIFIEAYGLKHELDEKVDLNEITLTCNPHYRYGVEECEVGSEKWEEMEARLLQDTMKELVSFAVGCMFGRYSLDMPGLVLANQGESIADYIRKVESLKRKVGRNENDSEKLSGTDRLAEGDGFGGDDLSGDTAIPQGGALRSDESNSQGGRFNSIKHSGGSGEAINSGVQKLSVDSTGFKSGSRNSANDCSTSGLCSSTAGRTNPESLRGDQAHGLLPDSQAVLTSHFPLPTSHLSFVPDEDNVIPMLDGDWFTDDIAERFRKFLRVAYGDEYYEENLRFIEQALGKNGKARDIRDYFLKDFYSDHVRRYKKRPIYWLFSSSKGSFNALIYMHRYRPDTVSVVLNDYLREFRTKLTSHKNHLEAVSINASSSQGEKTKALKEIEKITRMIAEMEEYEREVLYPLATEQMEIDLDDGVKVNYPKLGKALKKIVGLDAKEED